MRAARALAATAIILSLSTAAEAAQRHRLHLPAGRLGEAANALGRQAGISIGIRDPALAATPVPAVQGRLSVEDALKRMLVRAGARAVPLGPRTWLIVAAPVQAPQPRTTPQRIAKREPTKPRPRPMRPVAAVETEAEEIVVTGSKRRLALADYPGVATLIDGDDPAFVGLRGSEGLVERVSAVTSTHLGPGRNKLFLRGIADSSFNGPTQATVGQYLGETRLNYNAPDPDLKLHDVQRIEILPGPQGTLYGAGSVGGIIRVLPNAPNLYDLENAASAGVSAVQHGGIGGDLAGLINVPIAPGRAALRLSGYGESEAGYIDDLGRGLDDVNRTRTIGGRAALRLRSGSGWTVDLGLTGQRIRGEDAQFAERDGPPLTRHSVVPQDFRNGYALADVVVSKQWDDLHFVTATGLVRQTLTEHYDSTRGNGPPTQFEQRTEVTMLSADARLSREAPQGRGWLIGASMISNRSEQSRALGAPGALKPITGVRNGIEEATVYGEASVGLTDMLTLTGGARISHSRLSGAALDAPIAFAALLRTIEASRSETSFLPSIALSGEASPRLSFFLRYQEGFRPGGLSVTGILVQRFRNDRVATLEGGFRLLGGPERDVEAAASVSYTRWSDIQADIIDFDGLPTTTNIGDGRIYTLDLRAGWRPASGLSFDVAAVLNDSRVTNPAPSVIMTPSAPLPNVAKVNARIGAEYHAPLGPDLALRLTASARYIGRSRLGIGPILGEPQGDWVDTRLGARLERGRHAWSLTVSNLLDEVGNRFAFGSPFTLAETRQITPMQPRTVRLGWDVTF
ncbi:TonB-dependent receptor [Allosphingosinicella deserti]|uniref:TonB-dependent receptor n=1 Tax=Allosphingosinicella deserti TaxID=2116704 RepID=A0A2P7QER2_9SPHN|nr:TonB-dependent receptor [Sphingomonas deserti]PSJ36457.1 TonB-dependent receptor [Sphingomonas deserti]